MGDARVVNTVLLGALPAFLDVPPEVWLKIIEGRVPESLIELNQRAFWAGRNFRPYIKSSKPS